MNRSRSPLPRCWRIAPLLVAFALLAPASSLAEDIYVTINGPRNPVLPQQYEPGSSISFTINSPPPTGAYQWFHNDAAIPGATGASLALAHLVVADAGNYQLKVTANGSISASQTLTVNVLPFPPSPVDSSFTADLPATNGGPAVRLVFNDDSVLLTLAGTNSLVRLNADGSRDTTFAPADPTVGVLAALPNKGLLIATAPYRLHADGSPDPLALPAGLDPAKPLTAGAIQADGKILLAQGSQVVRLKADDSLDATFAYSTSLGTLHFVTGFTFDPLGRVYVTATQRDPNPNNFPQSWPVIFKLMATGAEDTGFVHQSPPLLRGGIALYPLADGRLLRFASYEGIPYWAMLRDDGTPDPAWSPGSTYIPSSFAVDTVNNRIFSLDYSGIHRSLITATTLVNDPTFYQGSGYANYLTIAPSGRLLVTGSFTDWDGHTAPGLVRLRTADAVTTFPPVAFAAGDVTPVKGQTQEFRGTVTGTGPFTYEWLALDGQPLPADHTSPTLTITNFDTVNFGRYQLRVTGPGGSVLSGVVRATYGGAITQLPFLANISGRAYVGTGDDTAIAGFAVKVYAGALGVPTLLRGAGPALKDYGVTSTLPNPVLNLYNSVSQLIANNDNWGGNAAIATAAATTGAFPFAADSNDAALLKTFYTGNATLQLADQGNASGVGVLEIYRVPADNVVGEFLNLSLRARTAPGEKVATAGFVVVDPQNFGRPVKLLLRAVGPTLSQSGIAFPLADPVLTLYRSSGEVVAVNDNWSDNANASAITSTAAQVGAFALPASSKDAALLLDVAPGVYSIQATAATGAPATGVTLIEIYLVR